MTFSTTGRISREFQIVLSRNVELTKRAFRSRAYQMFSASIVGMTVFITTNNITANYPTCNPAGHVNPRILQFAGFRKSKNALLMTVTIEIVPMAKFRARKIQSLLSELPLDYLAI